MNDLLQLAIDAHGGAARWREVQSIGVRMNLTGMLYTVKGFPEGLTNVVVKADAHRPYVTITPYGPAGGIGHFTPERVWVTAPDGSVIEAREDPRASFAGHELMTKWDPLQRLYFTSYALWNYLTTPFLLAEPGVESQEIAPHVENGETWRRLRVTFPPSVPTHCAEQIFYFNAKGLLQRLDYTTEIAGGKAAHYCFDHATVDGLVFPTLRRVVRNTPEGPMLSNPTGVLLQLGDIVVA